MPRIIGLTHANDILLSSRVFTAEEALPMGFLNRIVPPEALMAARPVPEPLSAVRTAVSEPV